MIPIHPIALLIVTMTWCCGMPLAQAQPPGAKFVVTSDDYNNNISNQDAQETKEMVLETIEWAKKIDMMIQEQKRRNAEENHEICHLQVDAMGKLMQIHQGDDWNPIASGGRMSRPFHELSSRVTKMMRDNGGVSPVDMKNELVFAVDWALQIGERALRLDLEFKKDCPDYGKHHIKRIAYIFWPKFVQVMEGEINEALFFEDTGDFFDRVIHSSM